MVKSRIGAAKIILSFLGFWATRWYIQMKLKIRVMVIFFASEVPLTKHSSKRGQIQFIKTITIQPESRQRYSMSWGVLLNIEYWGMVGKYDITGTKSKEEPSSAQWQSCVNATARPLVWKDGSSLRLFSHQARKRRQNSGPCEPPNMGLLKLGSSPVLLNCSLKARAQPFVCQAEVPTFMFPAKISPWHSLFG